MAKILAGLKTWEMRSTACGKREVIALIESKSGAVIGKATLVDCLGPLSKAQLKQNMQQHQGSAESVDQMFGYARPHAWVLAEVHRFKRPIPYEHPSGAVIWVNLDKLAAKIRAAK